MLGASLPPEVLTVIELLGLAAEIAMDLWYIFQSSDTGVLTFINWVVLMGVAAVSFIMAWDNVNSFFSSIFSPLIDAINALMRSTQPTTPLRPIRVGRTTLDAGQRFGAERSGGRAHAGVDFAGMFGQPGGLPLPNVYASMGGYVVRYYHFWENTMGLEVINDDGTILRYTELISTLPGLTVSNPIRDTPARNNLRIRIERGDVLGRLIPNTYNGFAVLHLEHYNGTDRNGNVLRTNLLNYRSNRSTFDFVPIRGYERRRDLLDPTPFHSLPQW